MNNLHLMIPLAAALLAAGCTNTTVIGHKTAIDINAEFSGDLARPLSSNIGYESHSAVAVPPQKSQGLRELFRIGQLPQGDVLPTVTGVKIQRVTGTDANGVAVNDPGSRYALDYIAAAATGDAAIAATTRSKPPSTGSTTGATGTRATFSGGGSQTFGSFSEAAATITGDQKSISTRVE